VGAAATFERDYGTTGCGGGIDERLCEEGFSASLSPPIFGKTEVTRDGGS
jgi:hypothetical protein